MEYSIEQKEMITSALVAYIKDTRCAAAKIANDLNINEAFLSQVRNGKYSITKSTIKTRQLSMIAKYVGLAFERKWWYKVDTLQSMSIEAYLYEAKDFATIKTIIGDTGVGKTYTVDCFVEANKQDVVYRITVGALHTMVNVIDDIMHTMNLECKGDKVSKLRKIEARMKELSHMGRKPLLIIDEAENLKLPIIGLMKQIYDILVKPRYCGVVLIGTSQLIDKFEKMVRKNKIGVPQFMRRIKSGIERVYSVEWHEDKAFMIYLQELVGDDRIITLLKENASNYGEVNDFIEPAMRDADRLCEEFNYEFFKNKYRL
ncbi:MAG: ATP-binding protein [Rikenellaceae bacterium]